MGLELAELNYHLRVLPSADVAAIEAFCQERNSADPSDEMRIESVVSPGAVTIVERHPPWQGGAGLEWSSTDVARLRYTKTTSTWALYSPTRDGRWRRYELIGTTPRVEPLLREVDRDPTCIFWG